MKILKTAQQKNFKVDTYFYTEQEIESMLDSETIFKLFDHYVVFAEDCKSVTVEYNKHFGFYNTIATLYTGTKLHIKL